jgi:hypothetical protein
MRKDRDKKGGSLACARLRLPRNITPSKGLGKDGRLNGSAEAELKISDRAHHFLMYR